MSSGGGRYESPPCRFDRERFERWKREAEGQEDEENLATREWKDEGKWKKNGGGRKLESEFRERWAEGLCVKCKAEKEGSRVVSSILSFWGDRYDSQNLKVEKALFFFTMEVAIRSYPKP